jgi:hypothetical protein
MCALASYIYTGIFVTIKSYLKAFAKEIMRRIYRGFQVTAVLPLHRQTVLLKEQEHLEVD